MPSKLERFRQLPPDERLLLAYSAVALLLVGVSLRLSGFRRTFDRVERLAVNPHQNPTDDPPGEIDKAAEAVTRAAYHLPVYRPTCLPQSLVLWHLLRRQGLPAELRIGVRKEGGDFTAHAWVEYAGQVVNDAPDVAQRYAPVDLPASLAGARW